MRLLFVNRFFWPDTPATGQLLTDLATALAASGNDIVVITSGRPPGCQLPAETAGRLSILRTGGLRLAPHNVLGKALAFASFSAGALWKLLRVTRRGDLVVIMTDPPLLAVFAGWIAHARGARVVHWVQDIYPEVAVEVTGHSWLRALRPLRDAAWRRADHIVTLGADMAAVVAAAGVQARRITVTPNWAPAGLQPLGPEDEGVRAQRRAWGLDGHFVVAYSGNLGRVHDLEPVIRAAALLRADPRIVFLFIGGGAQRAKLEAEVRHEGLANVRFVDAQPRERLGASLGAGDVHLVTLKPGCERYVYPSKLYGIAAVGRPILFVGSPDCELARLVAHSGLGRAVDRNDPAALAAAVREFAGNPAELAKWRAASADFGRASRLEAAATAWRATLESVRACP